VSDSKGVPAFVYHGVSPVYAPLGLTRAGVWDGYFKAWPASNEQDIKTYWERKPWHPDALRMYGFTGSVAHTSPACI
jgi:hypothetical protein